MKKEIKEKPIEFRCLDFSNYELREKDDKKVISGYAAVFEQWTENVWFKERIARGAFDSTDFEMCVACYNHDASKLLARYSSGTLKLDVDEKGLKYEFEIPNTSLGNDLFELIQRGDISKSSFKFVVEKESWKYAEDNSLLDERTIESIKTLYDVSPVIYPAYDQTSVNARSDEFMKAEKEEYIKAKNNNQNNAESESRARLCQQLSLGKRIL